MNRCESEPETINVIVQSSVPTYPPPQRYHNAILLSLSCQNAPPENGMANVPSHSRSGTITGFAEWYLQKDADT